MKKYYIMGILVIILVIFACGCVSSNNNNHNNTNKTEIQTVSQGGVIVKFPSDWVVANSRSNDSVVAIADSNSIDSSKMGKVNVNIEKQNLNGESLNTLFNKTYTLISSNSSNQIISFGNSSQISGKQGYEADYITDVSSDSKEHKAIWVESNGQAYVILCSAPQNEFSSKNKYFDFIIENIQIS